MREDRKFESDFCLFSTDLLADIVVDGQDNQTVKLAAGLFCEDIERVSGRKALLREDIESCSADCVIIGSIKESKIIRKLINTGKIDVREIEDQWESCMIEVVDNPFKGIDKALVIAGSDRRGTAYGIFELSKQMGVSPWYYFADALPVMRDVIYLEDSRYVLKSPSVKYRGIFINDEMWGIRPWAQHTLAPEEGKGLGPATYSKIFELLLRLKANVQSDDHQW